MPLLYNTTPRFFSGKIFANFFAFRRKKCEFVAKWGRVILILTKCVYRKGDIGGRFVKRYHSVFGGKNKDTTNTRNSTGRATSGLEKSLKNRKRNAPFSGARIRIPQMSKIRQDVPRPDWKKIGKTQKRAKKEGRRPLLPRRQRRPQAQHRVRPGRCRRYPS